jgi:serine protease Do
MSSHRLLPPALLVSVVLGSLGPLALGGSPPVRKTNVVRVVEKARPAVVNIHSERTARGPAVEELFANSPSQHRANGMGTGIIIDPRGYIITNQHVVEDVSVIRVRLHDRSTHIARVLARDKENDLAILKIDTSQPLAVITIGTSSDLMQGETVIAIGNAYGYEHTVTVGTVSALNRDVRLNKEISYKALIQTDAAINPGNSGGPLLNIHGELIGVNVAIRAGAQGISFAIPVDQMVRVAAELLAARRRADVTLGFSYRDDYDLTRTPIRMLRVERLDPAGAAGQADVAAGDIILRAGDVPVGSSLDLERALIDLKPGDELPLTVRRGDAERKLQLALRPASAAPVAADLAWRHLGVRLSPAGGEVVGRTNPTLRGGMLVTDVNPDGPAGRAGVQRGDILIGLHQWETVSYDHVLYVLTQPNLAELYPLRFYLLRSGQLHRGWLQAAE